MPYTVTYQSNHQATSKQVAYNQSKTVSRLISMMLSLFICIAPISMVSAKTGDTDQPMHISSGTQALDITNNVATFTESVIITQGTINIKADKVVVTTPNGDQTKAVVDAFGSPLTFSQLQDDGKPIEGYAKQMRYELDSERITLTGDAFISQLDSNVKGDTIVYLVKEQKMEAKGKKVFTVLNPQQIQEKK